MTPTGTVHKSFICTGLKRSFHSHPVKPSTQIQLSNTIHLNSLKTDVYTELLRHATHQTHLLASISHLCLMGRCPFSLLSTFFEVKKHEWHSSYLSNQLQKKLDKLLLNWDVCIILANYLFILGYSHCSLNCCPKSYQVTWPQETDSETTDSPTNLHNQLYLKNEGTSLLNEYKTSEVQLQCSRQVCLMSQSNGKRYQRAMVCRRNAKGFWNNLRSW